MIVRWLALALVAVPALANAQALSSDETARIERVVADTIVRTKVPAVEIAVVRGGSVVFERAFGQASAVLGPAQPTMPFQIASNSKQFLAALILLLADQGKLSLDEPIARWLPEVTGAQTITLRQLLSHTAGVQDYWPQDFAFPAMRQPVSPDAIIRHWAMQPLDFAPGTRWQYSNTGYVLAGQIAERAGGAPLANLFDTLLFAPLHIHPLFIDDATGPAYPHGHDRYALGPVFAVTPPARGWLYAAGELSMTAGELARWDVARINRALLPARDWAMQETPVLLANGTSSHYGLGVHVGERDGRRVIDHSGESLGFLSRNTVWPDDRAAVVVLTNAGFSNASGALTDAIAAIILPPPPAGEPLREADAAAELAALRHDRFDPARFTANGQSYFTATAREAYAHTLGQCGALRSTGAPELRGGLVNRNFALVCGQRHLTLITYAEPGAHGRWEQFLLSED